MSANRLGEAGFIEGIRRRFGALAPRSPAGIGDDAALLPGTGRGLLATTDCLIEGCHFRRDEPAYLLGRKSLAVNLSDIAAMGGRPAAFLLTVGLPRGLPRGFIDGFLAGLAACARQHRVKLVGGDTSGSPGFLAVSLTVIGRAGRGPGAVCLTRAGARAGDGIYVSGPLGASAAGRALLERGWRARLDRAGRRIRGAAAPRGAGRARPPAGRSLSTRAAEAMRAHFDPSPRLSLGRRLLEHRIASAAIDLSDGLSTDLARLADASGVGCRLLSAAIPVADSARALAPLLGTEPLDLALDGGEDYELLFTVPPSREARLARLDAIYVGRVTPRRRGLRIAGPSGAERPLTPGGWDHLARA